jgi:hypothetical protein
MVAAAALEQGAIDGVEAPSPLPSCALLPSPSLHEQGVTDGAEAPLLSTHEQGTADDAEVPRHHCKSGGQLTAPKRYRTGRSQCHRCAREG